MLAKFLYNNLKWQFNKSPFENLVGASTTEQQYCQQLESIANSYFPLTKHVSVAETEFCLNRIALMHAATPTEKAALSYFGEYWMHYVRLKRLFDKKYLLFPANTEQTRIETIAELLCKCTQCTLDNDATELLLDKTCELLELTEREQRYLPEVVRLYRVKYYCAAVALLFDKTPNAERHTAQLLKPSLLKYPFVFNKKYCSAAYASKQIATVVDCMGISAVRLGNIPTKVESKLFVYAEGRNVFDTFVQSKFGERHAEFASETRTMHLQMHYFLDGNREIRSCVLTNNGKRPRKFTIEVPLRSTVSNKTSYFRMGSSLCIATSCFSALTIVHNNHPVECHGEYAQLFEIKIAAGRSYQFDIVMSFADNTPALAEESESLCRFGATACPYLWDNACSRLNFAGTPLVISAHGYMPIKPQRVPAEQINFSYQLGNSDVATFLDNAGNCTTLLGGFVFGVKGEGVFSVRNGYMTKLNEHTFLLDGDKLQYEKKQAKLVITHDEAKTYEVTSSQPSRTLFYFPLEHHSKITYDKRDNAFDICDDERHYKVKCFGEVESYTANALECNEEKLRYRLSGNLDGSCLAICFARATDVRLSILSFACTPCSTPIIRESLVSTYLNYVNDKNVFCINNKLKRVDSLTLTAICYTNPQFVKEYLQQNLDDSAAGYYYDCKGERRSFCDKFATALATIYYLNLVGDLPADLVKKACDTLFNEKVEGYDLCIKALALSKAAKLNCFDKVKCLVEYGNLKKQIVTNSNLLAYAQAIGAIPMTNPSKERLKDLCNRYSITKSWYYVSQLENLYGLNISEGKLQIRPQISAENVLEQFALNIAGKRIDTSFSKASVQCMTLNGQQCFSPFYAPSLKNERNELIVSY